MFLLSSQTQPSVISCSHFFVKFMVQSVHMLLPMSNITLLNNSFVSKEIIHWSIIMHVLKCEQGYGLKLRGLWIGKLTHFTCLRSVMSAWDTVYTVLAWSNWWSKWGKWALVYEELLIKQDWQRIRKLTLASPPVWFAGVISFLSLELSLKKVCAGQCKRWLWDGRKSNNNSDKVKTRTKGRQKSSGTCVGEGASRVLEEWTLFPVPWVTPAPARRAGKGAVVFPGWALQAGCGQEACLEPAPCSTPCLL